MTIVVDLGLKVGQQRCGIELFKLFKESFTTLRSKRNALLIYQCFVVYHVKYPTYIFQLKSPLLLEVEIKVKVNTFF